MYLVLGDCEGRIRCDGCGAARWDYDGRCEYCGSRFAPRVYQIDQSFASPCRAGTDYLSTGSFWRDASTWRT